MSAATKRMSQLAERFIPDPKGDFRVTHENGDTQDIINNVLSGYGHGRLQLVEFAKACQREGLLTPYNVWDFVRNEIQYRLDPAGWQWIKTPSAVWQSGFSDCKNKSIFTASLFTVCKVPFAFRFTSYGPEPIYTHVYLVVSHQGRLIPVDSVYTEFGKEKPFTFKKDYPMKIAQISGIGAKPEMRKPTHGGKLSKPASGKLSLKAIPEGVDMFKLKAGELSAYLHLQRLKLKQKHAQAVKGIGSMADEVLQDQIELTQDIIDNYDDDAALNIIADQAAEGKYDTARAVMGIGAVSKKKAVRQEKKAARKEEKAVRKASGKTTGAASKPGPDGKPKGIKKVVQAVKKVATVAIKAATAVPRLIIKGIIEVELPKAAPNFLYLFVNKPELIAKLPEAARKKRKKQEEIFLFITKHIGMKSDHVMQILRNGILERTGKEPEQLLAAQLGGQIAGIGVITDAFEILVKIITKIAELIKAKGPKFEKNDAPDVAADFPAAGGTQSRQMAVAVQQQKPDLIAQVEADAGIAEDDGDDIIPAARTPRKGLC